MIGLKQLAWTMYCALGTLAKDKSARLFIETTLGTYAINNHAVTMYQAVECDIRVSADGLDMSKAWVDVLYASGDEYIIIAHPENDTKIRLKLDRIKTIDFRQKEGDVLHHSIWYRDGKIADWIIQREEEEEAERRANEDWEKGREAGWDAWEEVHYGGAQ